ncbi:M56 family metallopeptidase [Micromonospora sp. WMMD967]|uniref:M56 family metallopeptidase n=1 Tax=Micromonospora sp. WMMD967 TaxID=3016101 RepID=UPI00241792C1|nr:M56 family metallopeptidase [Micromonospora sp. WMMD967]MDG4839508.1 M56 family metallopeptidase [Micromonospora sp. WMMD967]
MRFVVDLTSPRVTGLAFGHAGRRYIALNRGLIALADRDPAQFRGVVLHELAHVRNRDIDVAYFTVLLWRVFVGVFLIPIVLLFEDALSNASFSRGGPFGLLLQVWILAVVVLLCHHAVLRERELEADLRAGSWGADDALRRTFARLAPREYEESGWHRIRRFLHGLIVLHPEPWLRAAALGAPGSGPRAQPLPASQALMLGLIVGLTWMPSLLVLSTVERSTGLLPDALTLPAVAVPALAPLTSLFGLAVGVLVWRAVLTTLADAAVWRRIHLFGLSLGAGLAGGELLTPQDSLLGPGAFGLLHAAVLEPPARLAYAGLLLVGAWLFVCWSAVSAVAWRTSLLRLGGRRLGYSSSHQPAAVVWLATTVGAVAMTGWLTPLLGHRTLSEPAAVAGDAGRYFDYLTDGFTEVVPRQAMIMLLIVMLALPVVGLLTGMSGGRSIHVSGLRAPDIRAEHPHQVDDVNRICPACSANHRRRDRCPGQME